MKSHTEYLSFNTKKEREFINITASAEEILEKSRIREGTAGVYVNDAEDGLIQDIEEWLERLAPRGDYRHASPAVVSPYRTTQRVAWSA